MKDIVIGTAGHIDHGKTTVIKYLTGVDTDTLPEEAKRGMTIDLGFTYFELSTGDKIGIIDVPGHEKFIKNMVAGATGIDYILFIIACDDGIMPQTIEHADIINLLGIKKGVILLTKRDLATDERVEEIKTDIKSTFKNSIISQLPILEISSKSLESFTELKYFLEKDLASIKAKSETKKPFKLSIDRVFSIKGFGTVVTGTPAQGIVKKDDALTLYPKMIDVKIRGIENHGIKVDFLSSGNRCALNLSGVETSEIKRGDILAPKGSMFITSKIDCFFTLLKGKKSIKNNHRIRLHIGTNEIIGKIKLLGTDLLEGGNSSFIQIDLEKPLVCSTGEIGILRTYSPMDTIGGIKIISPLGQKTKRNNTSYIQSLKSLMGENKEKIEEIIKNSSSNLITAKEVSIYLGKEITDDEIIELNDNIIRFKISEESKYFHIKNYNFLKNSIQEYLEKFHINNSLKKGASRSEIKNKFFNAFKTKEYNIVLEDLQNDFLNVDKDSISLKSFSIKLSKENKVLKDQIFKIYKDFSFSPKSVQEIEENFLNKEEFYKLHNYMLDTEFMVPLTKNMYVLKGFFKEAEIRLRKHFAHHDKLDLSTFKTLLNTSRKFALLYLEKFDELEITKRIEDYRILKMEENK
ncbi:selenocysteine-specific translation elongation factor [Cetobacterium sp. 2A]|uniref:selenocysteine-specific translation elongation factor n=1 Tax=Cetobacterium sp. 2A TaxID=2754723 RepID=UPI00163BA699|nr:selenocysteine-specific translation elongation factor [Cetobacterium sp. 2A]MBC2855667.1 selenocysteine-specific translation elongation factor [Cetobacterium sp. 2A]